MHGSPNQKLYGRQTIIQKINLIPERNVFKMNSKETGIL